MTEPRSSADRLEDATTLTSGPHALPGFPEGLSALPVATVAVAPAPHADFELGDVIGAGGMGQVISARQTALDRTVAAKFLRGKAGDAGALVREAIITGRLEHPNIVPVHVLAVTSAGAPFFTMKRIEGTPWSTALAAGQPLLEALEVLGRVCDAVAFAHARDVLHRDVKPSNVMVGNFGEVYLVDWGLAVSLTPDTVLPLASTSSFAGTPAYLAPEMAAGDGPALCPQTDVYLLGATLYEVLTGRPPHQGAGPGDAVSVALEGKVPVFEASVPPRLAAICRKAMAKLPAERHASAQAFKEAITGYLRHREAPRATASPASSGIAPECSTRLVVGQRRATSSSSESPLRSGMWKSLTTVSNAWCSRNPSAAAADDARVRSATFARARAMLLPTSTSSSTSSTRGRARKGRGLARDETQLSVTSVCASPAHWRCFTALTTWRPPLAVSSSSKKPMVCHVAHSAAVGCMP